MLYSIVGCRDGDEGVRDRGLRDAGIRDGGSGEFREGEFKDVGFGEGEFREGEFKDVGFREGELEDVMNSGDEGDIRDRGDDSGLLISKVPLSGNVNISESSFE